MIVDVYYVLCTADYIFMHVEILVHLLKLVANVQWAWLVSDMARERNIIALLIC